MSANSVTCSVSPSLALIKYWGKLDPARNLPATPSLSLNLRDLVTTTTVREGEEDEVFVDGEASPRERFAPFFDNLRAALDTDMRFRAESSNNFPTSAGLASSSSGFAALTAACVRLAGQERTLEELSALARVGSASAARAFYGGFALLPAGATHAVALHPPDWWPELRILVVKIDTGKKSVSSRKAMEDVRMTSPFYESWVSRSSVVLEEAMSALARRDLDALGTAVRHSYMSMFATMIGANPPILYWKPESVAVIRACAELRESGTPAWETMDAGPQVKVLCLEKDADAVRRGIAAMVPGLDPERDMILTAPGPGIRYGA